MPQFDLTTYSSQIFWLAICFTFLYICVSKIILPRIANIIENRDSQINGDKTSAAALNEKIDSLQAVIKTLRKTASTNYQNRIDEATKEAAAKRASSLESLKTKLDKDSQKSRQEIKDFVEKTIAQTESVSKDLEAKINEKLFGESLAAKVK